MNNTLDYSVFEYLYRDAGNWKAWGQLLLEGASNDDDISSLRANLESGQFFIAEQLGVPTLFQAFQAQYGGPTQDDHPWHEFDCVRPATQAEINHGSVWGTMQSLIERVNSIEAWESLSA